MVTRKQKPKRSGRGEHNWLTAKEVQKSKPGRYADGNGLYLVVDAKGNKRWEFAYDARRFGKRGGKCGKSNKRYMGLGSVRDVTLAEAREKRRVQRALIVAGHDPLEHRRKEEHRRWLAHAKSATFKMMADDLVRAKSQDAAKPWKESTRVGAEAIINNHLKPLHNLRCADITPQHIYDIVNPLRVEIPAMAHAVLVRARTIFDWAHARNAMDGKANPASMRGELRVLFGTDDIEPEHKPMPALDWHKVTALMAKLGEFKPRNHYTVGEAARACAISYSRIYNAIAKGRLKSTKPEYPVFAGSWQEHQIEPAELFKVFPKFVDVIPGLPPVSVYLLQFLILNGSRFDEVHYMVWDEWQRDTGLWVIPWQRMKSRNKHGAKEIRIDHVIPLSQRSIKILTMLDEQRQRDRNDSKYVFGNYRTANNTSARIGRPICGQNVLNLLRRLVGPEDADKVLHGMRTAFRSWGGAQRRFAWSDLERSIAHVKGYGETPLIRLYSRDDDDVAPLIPIFDGWADFVTGSSGLPAGVTAFPIRKRA
jgi:integrase